jgi:transcriptional regulator
MYIPNHYKNENQAELIDFIHENSFGIIVIQGENAPIASHIPFMIKGSPEDGYHLVGHLSKKNQIAQLLKNSMSVLIIFNGPQHYISSSWYKEEEVPTWNYIAVHAYGSVSIQSDSALLDSLHELVAQHEKYEKNPVDLTKMRPKTINQYKGVIGFTISINTLEGAYKLSQTRKEDHQSIERELADKNNFQATEISNAMKKTNQFPSK